MEVADWDIQAVRRALKNGYDIRNRNLITEDMKFVQGADTRYPSLYVNGSLITKGDNITVLYSLYGGIYVVSNYRGQLVKISESKLIRYGTKHTLTNCKVSSRNGEKFISALYGTIDTIDDTIIKTSDKGVISIHLPFGISNVNIPREVCGNVVTTTDNIKIYGQCGGVKQMEFPDTLKSFNAEILRWFKGIEVLKIHGDLDIFKGMLTGYAPNIRSIYIGSIPTGINYMFAELGELTSVVFGKQPIEHTIGMFRHCKKLEADSLLGEGLMDIKYVAYEGCIVSKNIKLPSTVMKYTLNAFDNCQGLESVTLTSDRVFIRRNMDVRGECENGTRYSVYYPYTVKLDDVLYGYKLIRSKPTRKELINEEHLDRQIIKASLLGYNVPRYRLANTRAEIIGVLKAIDECEWNRQISECLKYEDGIDRYATKDKYIIAYRGIGLHVSFSRIIMSTDNLNILKNYAYSVAKHGGVTVRLLSKKLVTEFAIKYKKSLVSLYYTEESTGIDNSILAVEVRAVHFDTGKELADIREIGDTLVIKYKSGNKRVVTIDDFV